MDEREMTVRTDEIDVRFGPKVEGLVEFWTDVPRWIRRLEAAGADIYRRGTVPNDTGTKVVGHSVWARLPMRQVKFVLLSKEQADKRSENARARALKCNLAEKMRERRQLKKNGGSPGVVSP